MSPQTPSSHLPPSQTAAPTVWVIDDDATVLLLAEEVLCQTGFQVRTFEHARHALEAMSQSPPDAVILDVLLPDIDGFECCSRLRQLSCDVPVLMMTSMGDADAIEQAWKAGATDFTIKPLNWMIETHRLRYLLRSAGVAQQLRQTEQETRHAKEEWELTFNAITDVVTVMDANMRLRRVNAATAAMLGQSPGSMCGRCCFEVFRGAEKPCGTCPVLGTLRTGVAASAELPCCKGDTLFLLSASPVHDAQGKLSHVVHVARDLSQQKLLEREVRQAQKMEAIGTLAGGMAHEFNNLLQIIASAAGAVRGEGNLSEDESAQLQNILTATQRGGALTRHLLAFSRRTAVTNQKEAVNLAVQASSIQRLIGTTLPKNIVVRVEADPRLHAINSDLGQMQQVLINLIVNAAQAMPAGGTISLRVHNCHFAATEARPSPEMPSGDYVRLEVADTGCGMSPETMQRIYEPFFTTKEVGQGTGLGLSVVFGIVKEHGGVILCQSELGKGSNFRLFFPAIMSAGQAQAEHQPVSTLVGGHETLMIVDDEQLVLTTLQRTLQRLGYQIVASSSGESALRQFQEQKTPPALVILDLGMPGMDGWTCLQKLRALDASVKVLVASGYGGDDLEAKLAKVGANGYIGKPYKMANLTRQIRQIIEAPNKPLAN